MTDPSAFAVLVSGSGTNLQAILDAAPDAPFRVAVVIADRHGAGAEVRATAAGVPYVVVDWADFGSRHRFTDRVCDVAVDHGAGALVLAGFMRILAPEALSRFPSRVLNIHPSLLPSFPGADAVTQALAYGVKVTGVTVHFVDEQVDHGPIIAQRPVPVAEDDTSESLDARIQAAEHELYPYVLRSFVNGDLTIDGRLVTGAA